MTKLVSSAILLLFGAALTRLGLSDELLLYVRPSARLWVLLAGIALVLLAAWSIIDAGRGADRDDEATSGEHHHGQARSAWLVLAPVVAVLVIAPPALGAFTAGRAPTLNAGHAHPPRRSSDPVALRMNQLFLLANHQPAVLAGQPVILTGFVEKRTAGGFVLARLVITCCAADAFSVTAVVSTSAPVPPTNSWLRVTGSYTGIGADMTPELTASRLTPIKQPTDPYESP